MLEDLLKYSSVAAALAEEAREQGTRQATIMALQGRFGALPDDLQAAIRQANTSTLEAVLVHIGTDSLAQVRDRLALP